jgi:hypothetical protein
LTRGPKVDVKRRVGLPDRGLHHREGGEEAVRPVGRQVGAGTRDHSSGVGVTKQLFERLTRRSLPEIDNQVFAVLYSRDLVGHLYAGRHTRPACILIGPLARPDLTGITSKVRAARRSAALRFALRETALSTFAPS